MVKGEDARVPRYRVQGTRYKVQDAAYKVTVGETHLNKVLGDCFQTFHLFMKKSKLILVR